jgi:hypothetical protein
VWWPRSSNGWRLLSGSPDSSRPITEPNSNCYHSSFSIRAVEHRMLPGAVRHTGGYEMRDLLIRTSSTTSRPALRAAAEAAALGLGI